MVVPGWSGSVSADDAEGDRVVVWLCWVCCVGVESDALYCSSVSSRVVVGVVGIACACCGTDMKKRTINSSAVLTRILVPLLLALF